MEVQDFNVDDVLGAPLNIAVAWPGQRHNLEVTTTTTILEIKHMITKILNSQVPPSQQRLKYKNKVLKNKRTLAYYKVKSDRTIIMERLTDRGIKMKSNSWSRPIKINDNILNSEEYKMLVLKEGEQSNLSAPQEHDEQNSTFLMTPKSSATTLLSSASGGSFNDTVDNALDAWMAGEENFGTGEGVIQKSDAKQQKGVNLKTGEVDVYRAMLESNTPRGAEPLLVSQIKGQGNDGATISFTVVDEAGVEHNLKIPAKEDLFTVNMELEKLGVGQAGQLIIKDEDGEEYEDECTLEENDIEDGSRLFVFKK